MKGKVEQLEGRLSHSQEQAEEQRRHAHLYHSVKSQLDQELADKAKFMVQLDEVQQEILFK